MLSTGFWLACLSKPVLYLEMSLTIFTAGCCSILIFVEQLHFQCKKRKLLSFFLCWRIKFSYDLSDWEGDIFAKKKNCTKRIHLVFLVSRKTFYYLLCRDVWCTQTVATTYFYITKKIYNILCRIWNGWILMMIHTCLFLKCEMAMDDFL